jgi:hypothetical protein
MEVTMTADHEGLCRHELTLGTCADCHTDGSLRRNPPASVRLDDARAPFPSDRTAVGSGPLFPAAYPGRCVSDYPHRFEVGDLIQWSRDGYVCEGHAEVGL